MEQIPRFIKISELVDGYAMTKSPANKVVRAEHAVNLIEEAFHAIEGMDNADREETMRLLTGWLMAEKFGFEARPVLSAFRKYCIAECILHDIDWKPASHSLSGRPKG